MSLVIEHNSVFENLVGTVAMIATVIQLVGPMGVVLEGIKRMEIKTFDFRFVLISVIDSGLWIVYGLKLTEFPVYLTHIALFFIYLFFLNSIFWVNHEKDNMYKYSGMAIIGFAIAYTVLPKNFAGFFAFITKTGLNYFLVKKIQRALEKKNNEEMNLIQLQIALLASFLWLIYGLFLTNHAFIWIPNLIVLFITGMAVLTFFWTIDKIEDNSILIIYLKKLFQVETSEENSSKNFMNKKLNEDF